MVFMRKDLVNSQNWRVLITKLEVISIRLDFGLKPTLARLREYSKLRVVPVRKC